MRTLVELLLAALGLAEAELRRLRDGTFRAAGAVLLLCTALTLALLGVGAMLASALLAMGPHLGWPVATLLTGGCTLLAAMILLGVARWVKG